MEELVASLNMDTPNTNQIGTPISKFEDSPVFNYINSLSPIKAVETTSTAPIFTPLSFTSPPSIFASPHLMSYKESRFLRRHHLPDPSKPEFSHIENEDGTSERVPDTVQISDLCDEQLGCISPARSSRTLAKEPPYEKVKLVSESAKNLKYHSCRIDNDVVLVKKETTPELAGTSASPVQFVRDDSNERHHPELWQIHQIEQNKETAGCKWGNPISNASDMLISDVDGQYEEQNDNTINSWEDSFISNALELPNDDMNHTQKPQFDPVGSCTQHKMEETVNQLGVEELNETDQTPGILSSTLLCKVVSNDSSAEVDGKEGKCIESNYKKQLSIRRRCLVFETAGAHKKRLSCDPNNSSQSNYKIASNDKQMASFKSRNSYSASILPGIGLHLNALAASSMDGEVAKHEALVSGSQPISIPSSGSLFKSSISGQKLQEESLERDFVPNENKNEVMEDASWTTTLEVGEEFNNCNSPDNKRQRLEHDGGSEACKRCNCKKSKCLKLYCECFAAGLYCVEPCSCQDCFNKPVHEDTVLDTRKQIESRNPLAFAPKVVRNIDSLPEFGDDSNTTPASARHKRGCNCKKSSCLKKYCECFQGGVGCSIGCRCEGCKNSFGRKNGINEAEIEWDEMESFETNASDISSRNNVVHKLEEQHPDVAIPRTTSEICRASHQLPFRSSGKSLEPSLFAGGSAPQFPTSHKLGTSGGLCSRPKFEKHLEMIPEDNPPEILREKGPAASTVKSTSPNSKRISPPHNKIGPSSTWRRSRKLILRSIPSFPSLTSIQDFSDIPEKHH